MTSGSARSQAPCRSSFGVISTTITRGEGCEEAVSESAHARDCVSSPERGATAASAPASAASATTAPGGGRTGRRVGPEGARGTTDSRGRDVRRERGATDVIGRFTGPGDAAITRPRSRSRTSGGALRIATLVSMCRKAKSDACGIPPSREVWPAHASSVRAAGAFAASAPGGVLSCGVAGDDNVARRAGMAPAADVAFVADPRELFKTTARTQTASGWPIPRRGGARDVPLSAAPDGADRDHTMADRGRHRSGGP
jgi:hypothetical protein